METTGYTMGVVFRGRERERERERDGWMDGCRHEGYSFFEGLSRLCRGILGLYRL